MDDAFADPFCSCGKKSNQPDAAGSRAMQELITGQWRAKAFITLINRLYNYMPVTGRKSKRVRG